MVRIRQIRDPVALMALSMSSRGAAGKSFDWEQAAEILSERQPQKAIAGLGEDWSCTCGTIWKDGKPYTAGWAYLSSNWATPLLEIDGEQIECWKEGTDGPHEWPEELAEKLGGLVRESDDEGED